MATKRKAAGGPIAAAASSAAMQGGLTGRSVEESLNMMLPNLPPGTAMDQEGLEALGLAQEQARRKESTGSASSKYYLSMTPMPPRHPFVRCWFPVKLILLDFKRQLKTQWNIQLHIELLYENGEIVANQGKHVEVYGHDASRPIILSGTGSVDLKVRILSCSMAHEGKAFVIRFSGVPIDKHIPNYVTILPVQSIPMTVIRHRLRITEQPPGLWYKDEGGRDKCISISGLLVDEHEQSVQGREVPLKVLLCYEGDECVHVKTQSILKMPTDSIPKVDKFGKFNIKVRIEEVSKNHQKQAFVIRLEPDVAFSTDNFDISADVSTAITVLSKRNKRRPKRDGGDDDSPEGPVPVQGGLYPPQSLFLPAASATMPMQYPKILPTVNVGMNAAIAQASSSVLPSITPTGAVAKPSQHTLASTSLTGANMTRISSTDGPTMMQDTSEYKPQPPAPSFSDTISHLINWATHVHDLLTKIEWQHVGFEVQEDGQMNLHRPLYRCPGCWSYQDTIRQTGHKDTCKISKLSSAYRTHVHIYLQDLLNMALGSNGSMSGIMGTSQISQANNPSSSGLQSSNSTYPKGGAGNTNAFMSHQNSQIQKSNGPSNSFPISMAQGSMQRALSSTGGPTGSAKPEPNTDDNDQGPSNKKQKLDSSSLFPPSNSDWNNLAALDPLSSPNALDRGLSALTGPALVGERGMSVLGMLSGSGDTSMVGIQTYTSLGAFPSDGGGHHHSHSAQDSSYMSELPPVGDGLQLMRAGSSINIETLMQSDESQVDAIHVTATPFGFPAFSASTATTPASLLGYYQYDESTTFLAFVPLTKFPSITPTQVREMERIYRQLRHESTDGGSQSRILTRQQCITLEKLKEDALLLHYASQASSFLSTDTF